MSGDSYNRWVNVLIEWDIYEVVKHLMKHT